MTKDMKDLPFGKKLLFSVIASVGFLIVLFLLAVLVELGLRAYVHVKYSVPGKSYGIYMWNKELGVIHKPNSYSTSSVMNNWGFRNTMDIEKVKLKGSVRIYCSGGSTTFCYNLPTEQAWPSLLQSKLRKIPGHERDEVINAGHIVMPVSYEYMLAKRMIPVLKPDYVVLYGTGVNETLAAQVLENDEKADFDRLLAEQTWGIFPRSPRHAWFLNRHTILFKFIDYPLRMLEERLSVSLQKNPAAYTPHPWVTENFKHILGKYIDFLKGNGVKIIVVNYSDNGAETPLIRNSVRPLRDLVVKIAHEKGVIVSDLDSIVEKEPKRKDLYIDTGVHVSYQGAELVADTLLKSLMVQFSKSK